MQLTTEKATTSFWLPMSTVSFDLHVEGCHSFDILEACIIKFLNNSET